MNRSAAIDSELSLDAAAAACQIGAMIDRLYLERRDPSRNMARFYEISVEHDLFGTPLAVRRWGRIGTLGREMALACLSEEQALAEAGRLERAKRRRGYVKRSGQ